eukprot:13501192-Alexandrium_andersonii.AAC.1
MRTLVHRPRRLPPEYDLHLRSTPRPYSWPASRSEGTAPGLPPRSRPAVPRSGMGAPLVGARGYPSPVPGG